MSDLLSGPAGCRFRGGRIFFEENRVGAGLAGVGLDDQGSGHRAKGDATVCQSKMFDPPAPSDHLPCDAPTLRVVPVYYVLVPLSAVVALGVIQVARRGPRPVSLGSEALGHRTMLEVWV